MPGVHGSGNVSDLEGGHGGDVGTAEGADGHVHGCPPPATPESGVGCCASPSRDPLVLLGVGEPGVDGQQCRGVAASRNSPAARSATQAPKSPCAYGRPQRLVGERSRSRRAPRRRSRRTCADRCRPAGAASSSRGPLARRRRLAWRRVPASGAPHGRRHSGRAPGRPRPRIASPRTASGDIVAREGPGDRVKRAYAPERTPKPVREPLGGGDADAHAGERTRPATDDHPADLSDGEAVAQPAATRVIGSSRDMAARGASTTAAPMSSSRSSPRRARPTVVRSVAVSSASRS